AQGFPAKAGKQTCLCPPPGRALMRKRAGTSICRYMPGDRETATFDYGVTRQVVHGQAQGRAATAAALSSLCDRSGGDSVRRRGTSGRARVGRLDAGLTNASMPTTFNAFTRATISHCNGVCRIDCEQVVGQFDCGGGLDAVAPSRAIAAQVLQ